MRRPAGFYNRSITIRQHVPSPDTAGGLDSGTTPTLCTRFAHLQTTGGRERQEKLQQHAETDVAFLLPYDAVAITAAPEMTVLYGSRVFEISSVLDVDDAHEEIRITATERVL